MTDRHRSAIAGEFVTAEHARTNPDTTVSESRDDLAAELRRLRGVNHTLTDALDVLAAIEACTLVFINDAGADDGWPLASDILNLLGDDANSNSKAQLGVGLEPIAFDPPLTDDEAGAFLDAITTDEADQ